MTSLSEFRVLELLAAAHPIMLALIAHDNKKDDLVSLAKRRRDILARFPLIATGTTGGLVAAATELNVICVKSGPLGGDAQIAARVAQDEVRAVIFLVDPLFAHPHEPDVQGLVRICNVHNVPLALNLATAEMLLDALNRNASNQDTPSVEQNAG